MYGQVNRLRYAIKYTQRRVKLRFFTGVRLKRDVKVAVAVAVAGQLKSGIYAVAKYKSSMLTNPRNAV